MKCETQIFSKSQFKLAIQYRVQQTEKITIETKQWLSTIFNKIESIPKTRKHENFWNSVLICSFYNVLVIQRKINQKYDKCEVLWNMSMLKNSIIPIHKTKTDKIGGLKILL